MLRKYFLPYLLAVLMFAIVISAETKTKRGDGYIEVFNDGSKLYQYVARQFGSKLDKLSVKSIRFRPKKGHPDAWQDIPWGGLGPVFRIANASSAAMPHVRRDVPSVDPALKQAFDALLETWTRCAEGESVYETRLDELSAEENLFTHTDAWMDVNGRRFNDGNGNAKILHDESVTYCKSVALQAGFTELSAARSTHALARRATSGVKWPYTPRPPVEGVYQNFWYDYPASFDFEMHIRWWERISRWYTSYGARARTIAPGNIASLRFQQMQTKNWKGIVDGSKPKGWPPAVEEIKRISDLKRMNGDLLRPSKIKSVLTDPYMTEGLNYPASPNDYFAPDPELPPEQLPLEGYDYVLGPRPDKSDKKAPAVPADPVDGGLQVAPEENPSAPQLNPASGEPNAGANAAQPGGEVPVSDVTAAVDANLPPSTGTAPVEPPLQNAPDTDPLVVDPAMRPVEGPLNPAPEVPPRPLGRPGTAPVGPPIQNAPISDPVVVDPAILPVEGPLNPAPEVPPRPLGRPGTFPRPPRSGAGRAKAPNLPTAPEANVPAAAGVEGEEAIQRAALAHAAESLLPASADGESVVVDLATDALAKNGQSSVLVNIPKGEPYTVRIPGGKSNLRVTIEDAANGLLSHEAEKLKMTGEIDTLTTQLRTSEAALLEVQSKLVLQETNIEGMVAESKALIDKISENSNRIHKLADDVQHGTGRIKELKELLRVAREPSEQQLLQQAIQKETIQGLEAQREQLQAQVQQMTEQMSSYTNTEDLLRGKVELLNRENDALKVLQADMEAGNAASGEQLSSVTLQKDALVSRASDLERELQGAKMAITEHETAAAAAIDRQTELLQRATQLEQQSTEIAERVIRQATAAEAPLEAAEAMAQIARMEEAAASADAIAMEFATVAPAVPEIVTGGVQAGTKVGAVRLLLSGRLGRSFHKGFRMLKSFANGYVKNYVIVGKVVWQQVLKGYRATKGAIQGVEALTIAAEAAAAMDGGAALTAPLLEAEAILNSGAVVADTAATAVGVAEGVVGGVEAGIVASEVALEGGAAAIGIAEAALGVAEGAAVAAEVGVAGLETGVLIGFLAAEGAVAAAGTATAPTLIGPAIAIAVDVLLIVLSAYMHEIIHAALDPRKKIEFEGMWMDIDGDNMLEKLSRWSVHFVPDNALLEAYVAKIDHYYETTQLTYWDPNIRDVTVKWKGDVAGSMASAHAVVALLKSGLSPKDKALQLRDFLHRPNVMDNELKSFLTVTGDFDQDGDDEDMHIDYDDRGDGLGELTIKGNIHGTGHNDDILKLLDGRIVEQKMGGDQCGGKLQRPCR